MRKPSSCALAIRLQTAGSLTLGRVLVASVDGDNILDKHGDGLEMHVVLLVKRERLLMQTMLDGNVGDLDDIEAVQLVDVVHDAALVGANGGQEEQLLQVAIVAEGGRLEDDLLEELDQLLRQVSREEGLDGDRDVFRICRFGDCDSDDLCTSSSSGTYTTDTALKRT